MKKMPRNLFFRLISLCLLFFPLLLSAQEINHPYISPTPGEITIMASTPIPEGLKSTRQDYEDLIECGFNLGNAALSIDGYKNEFNVIGDLNFKYLVYSTAFQSDKRKGFIDTFKDNKHVGGWNLKDEPNYDYLNELKEQYNAVYKLDPSKLIFVNLIGGVSKSATGPANNYAEYLEIIQNMFRPAVWSYDLYPISVKNGKITVAYDAFFGDLEAVSAISKRTGRPFWTYCQSMSYKRGSIERPAATEAYLRFANFSALAYGAQGILYWTYGQRKSNANETYFSALVDLNGKKTKAWYAAKTVNGEIKKYNDIFLNCNVLEVKHTGTTTYRDTKKLNGSFGPFAGVQSGSSGVLLSNIENNGKHYVVVVNHDVTKKQSVTFRLEGNKSVLELSSPKQTLHSAGAGFPITLDKGEYVIFEVVE